jgi:hypothetical protein
MSKLTDNQKNIAMEKRITEFNINYIEGLIYFLEGYKPKLNENMRETLHKTIDEIFLDYIEKRNKKIEEDLIALNAEKNILKSIANKNNK